MRNRFIRLQYLISNEMDRAKKILFPCILAFMGLILGYGTVKTLKYRKNIFQLKKNNSSDEIILKQFGDYLTSINLFKEIYTFMIIILLLGFIFIMIYSAFSWYREWFGENKTIYSIIMLPIKKSNIILSKLITSIIYCYLFFSTQIFSYFLIHKIFYIVIPKFFTSKIKFLYTIRIIDYKTIFKFGALANLHMLLFFLSIVLIIFVMVFLERCFKKTGIILALLYGSLFVFLYGILPFKFVSLFSFERLVYFVIISIISIVLNFYIANTLLNEKISV
ncbi:hypothetical protein [Clostridium ihumii]|uniref:hypothetical protein n=1 Tax=Clostridium ihumii TaxID=1470356 RepID=UPI003D34FD9F